MQNDIAPALRDRGRLDALRRLALLDTPAEPAFDRLTRLGARMMNAPIALVTLVEQDRQFFKSCLGLPEPWASQRETPLSHSFCQYTIEQQEPLIIEDARADALLRDNLAISDLNVVAYLGIPLITSTGDALGSFCVIDSQPRAWTADDVYIARELAASVMTEIELRNEIITRQEREAELERSHGQITDILESITDAFFALDRNWQFTYVNTQAEHLLRQDEYDLLGRTIWDEFPETVGTQFFQKYHEAVETRQPVTLEEYYPPLEMWVEVRAYPSRDGLAVYFQDVTERKELELELQQAKEELEQRVAARTVELYEANERLRVELAERERVQNALSESEERFRSLVQNASDIITILEADGTIRYESPSLERIVGYRPEDVVGRNAFEFVHPDDVPTVAAAFGETARVPQGSVVACEFRFRHRDGSWRTLEVIGTNLLHSPAVAGIVTNSRDITERKRGEQAIRDSEERFRSVLESANDAIVTADDQGRMLSWNAAATTMFGYTEAEVMGQSLQMLMPERYHAVHQAGMQRFLRTREPRVVGHTVELHGRRKDGSEFPLDLSLATWMMGDEVFFSGVMRDITERKQAETQIQLQLQRLAAMHALDLATSTSLDLQHTLDASLDQLSAQLPIAGAAIRLLNPTTNILEHVAARGTRAVAPPHPPITLSHELADAIGTSGTVIVGNGTSEPGMAGDDWWVPLRVRGDILGILELAPNAEVRPEQELLNFIETLAHQIALSIDNVELVKNLQHANVELARSYDATLEGWVHFLDLRDRETEGHTRRVTEMSVLLARQMGLPEEQIEHVRRGALLHDIGKMGIPDAILLKPGPLNDDEWVIMRRHPVYAFDMLAPIDFLRPALDIPYCHHEKWDGSGYPRGLRAEQIPREARIFAIVDVWDALRSDRPYRQGWSAERVREHVRALAGSHFDPEVVDAFLRLDVI